MPDPGKAAAGIGGQGWDQQDGEGTGMGDKGGDWSATCCIAGHRTQTAVQ